MSAWVLSWTLMLVYLRFGGAEGDPLPVSLMELVRNSPISSIEDLRLLLLTDSVEEDSGGQLNRNLHSNDTVNRLPRSLGAQPAQQALCKVRTEVLEVTRTMLDRRNANFLLWPPCVEVQRCSGCCNTRNLQCVPTLTHTRYLQVMKIQYVNKHPYYEKAIIPVLDHVECRCKSSSSALAPQTPQSKPYPNRQGSRDPKTKVRSKEELHRHDMLKQNQNILLEEAVIRDQPWDPFGHLHTLPTHERPGVPEKPTHNHTRQSQGRSRESLWQPHLSHPMGKDDGILRAHSTTEAGNLLTQHNVHDSQLPRLPVSQVPQYDSVRDGMEGPGLSSTEGDPEQTARGDHEASYPHKRAPSHSHTGTLRQKPTAVHQQQGALDTKQSQRQQQRLEEESFELSSMHRKFEEEKHSLKHGEQQQHIHGNHHHTETQSKTQSTGFSVTQPPTSTTHPLVPRLIQPPPQQNPPRKKKRKIRNRLSKASMRAMLM